MDKVFIKDLLIRGVIGISEKERSQPQDILVAVHDRLPLLVPSGSDIV